MLRKKPRVMSEGLGTRPRFCGFAVQDHSVVEIIVHRCFCVPFDLGSSPHLSPCHEHQNTCLVNELLSLSGKYKGTQPCLKKTCLH